MISRFMKRFIDVIGSASGILLTFLFLPFVALAIKLEDGGPVFVRLGARQLRQNHPGF